MPSGIGADAAKLAGLQIDLLVKMRGGQITLSQFERFVRGELTITADVQTQLARWTGLYGVVCSEVPVPSHQDGFDRLIVVPKGVNYDDIFQKCAGLFPTIKWTDKLLSTVISLKAEQRNPSRDGDYAIWVRDGQEPDRQWRNHSADQIIAKGIQTLTLLERLLLEWDYFKQTGKHLDIKGITLCAGSRYVDGSVPNVSWYDDRMPVGRCYPGNAHDNLGVREVVSIQK